MSKKIEFYVTPLGRVIVDESDESAGKEYKEGDYDLTEYMTELIQRQYPEAYLALQKAYSTYENNKHHYAYLIVHRFVRCNFGKFDGLTYDVENDVLHLEDVACPLKWGECPFKGIICNPKPFGLTEREKQIAKMASSGKTYKEISQQLGIAHSTIKNVIQKIRTKLHLNSAKDITKLFVTVI